MIWGRESILQAPILLPQAIWVAARAARLPEPEGPRSGQIGQGPDLRLLILGDSSAAGVGADHQSAALSGRLVHHLAPDFRVDWTLQAKSGATARTALVMLEDQPDAPMDAVVLVLGVNDAKNGVRHASWRERCEALLDLIAQKCAQPLVFVSGVPPLGNSRSFPTRCAVFLAIAQHNSTLSFERSQKLKAPYICPSICR